MNISQVTIFEKDPRIGGRISSARPYQDGSLADIGAYTFDADDKLIAKMFDPIDAVHSRRYLYTGSDKWTQNHLERVSVWDGETLTKSAAVPLPLTWTTLAQILKEHALYPKFWTGFRRFFKISLVFDDVGDLVDSELPRKCDWIHYHWIRSNLVTRWQCRAHQYAKSLIWAASRARFGPTNEDLQGLSDSYGMASKQQNITLLYSLASTLNDVVNQLGNKPHFSLNLNSTAIQITRLGNKTFDVHWTQPSLDGLQELHTQNFDFVVIAAPYHQSAIQLDPPLPEIPANTSYTPTWVTNFLSPKQLDTRIFNTEGASPEIIWSLEEERIKKADYECKTPSFISITYRLSPFGSGCVGGSEELYQITSREPFSDDDIAGMVQWCGRAREDVTFPDQACRELKEWEEGTWSGEKIIHQVGNNGTYSCAPAPDIRWVHRQFWPNGLVARNSDTRTSSNPWKLAPGLFYTSDFESRDGASVSGSVYNGKRVADMIGTGNGL